MKDWLTTQEAARILTENSGRPISSDYVRRLGNMGKIATKRIDNRTKLYSRRQVQSYVVKYLYRGVGQSRRKKT